MDQHWFEMNDIRRRRLNTAVWIPLRSSQNVLDSGKIAELGYQNEFYGVATIAVPLVEREVAETLTWSDLSLSRSHRSGVENGIYRQADSFHGYKGLNAVSLVLSQDGNSVDPTEWHLHQDLVIALSLKREGDNWLAMDEGYVEVARLVRGESGCCALLEIRAEHLKDYLCARDMALYVSSYRNREEVVADAGHITWNQNPVQETAPGDRWEGRKNEMHPGGFGVGSSAAVFHLGRENVDFEEDVPSISPVDENIVSNSWTIKRKGEIIFRIQGELWRTEWVEPAAQSPRVRDDELPPSAFFIIDASGTRKAGTELGQTGGWLWFRPEVMMALAHRRGGSMTWYTRDTGSVSCSPTSSTTFGVNKIGLINAYAEDIAYLPQWQQQVWAGFNIAPEGGVSQELLSAQAEGTPAETLSPEAFFPRALSSLNEVVRGTFGFELFRKHENSTALLKAAHRFRVTDQASLFALAKDLARLTAESIDHASLQRIVPPPKGEKWGSLKSLEKVLATKVTADEAHFHMGPLFGVNDLRQADAHLPSGDLQPSFDLVKVDRTAPFVTQGYELLHACVSAIFSIAEAFRTASKESN